jgi:hypothetical protein
MKEQTRKVSKHRLYVELEKKFEEETLKKLE